MKMGETEKASKEDLAEKFEKATPLQLPNQSPCHMHGKSKATKSLFWSVTILQVPNPIYVDLHQLVAG